MGSITENDTGIHVDLTDLLLLRFLELELRA